MPGSEENKELQKPKKLRTASNPEKLSQGNITSTSQPLTKPRGATTPPPSRIKPKKVVLDLGVLSPAEKVGIKYQAKKELQKIEQLCKDYDIKLNPDKTIDPAESKTDFGFFLTIQQKLLSDIANPKTNVTQGDLNIIQAFQKELPKQLAIVGDPPSKQTDLETTRKRAGTDPKQTKFKAFADKVKNTIFKKDEFSKIANEIFEGQNNVSRNYEAINVLRFELIADINNSPKVNKQTEPLTAKALGNLLDIQEVNTLKEQQDSSFVLTDIILENINNIIHKYQIDLNADSANVKALKAIENQVTDINKKIELGEPLSPKDIEDLRKAYKDTLYIENPRSNTLVAALKQEFETKQIQKMPNVRQTQKAQESTPQITEASQQRLDGLKNNLLSQIDTQVTRITAIQQSFSTPHESLENMKRQLLTQRTAVNSASTVQGLVTALRGTTNAIKASNVTIEVNKTNSSLITHLKNSNELGEYSKLGQGDTEKLASLFKSLSLLQKNINHEKFSDALELFNKDLKAFNNKLAEQGIDLNAKPITANPSQARQPSSKLDEQKTRINSSSPNHSMQNEHTTKFTEQTIEQQYEPKANKLNSQNISQPNIVHSNQQQSTSSNIPKTQNNISNTNQNLQFRDNSDPIDNSNNKFVEEVERLYRAREAEIEEDRADLELDEQTMLQQEKKEQHNKQDIQTQMAMNNSLETFENEVSASDISGQQQESDLSEKITSKTQSVFRQIGSVLKLNYQDRGLIISKLDKLQTQHGKQITPELRSRIETFRNSNDPKVFKNIKWDLSKMAASIMLSKCAESMQSVGTKTTRRNSMTAEKIITGAQERTSTPLRSRSASAPSTLDRSSTIKNEAKKLKNAAIDYNKNIPKDKLKTKVMQKFKDTYAALHTTFIKSNIVDSYKQNHRDSVEKKTDTRERSGTKYEPIKFIDISKIPQEWESAKAKHTSKRKLSSGISNDPSSELKGLPNAKKPHIKIGGNRSGSEGLGH